MAGISQSDRGGAVSIFDDRGRAATTPPIEDPYRGLGEHDRDIAVRLRRAEDTLLVTVGLDGTNGKLGNMRKDFDADRASRNRILTAIASAAASALVAAAVAIYAAGQRNGLSQAEKDAQQAEVAALRAEIRELRALLPLLRHAPARPAPPGDTP